MRLCLQVSVLVFSVLGTLGSGDVFTNPRLLEKLFQMEFDVIEILENTPVKASRLFHLYREHHRSAAQDVENSNAMDVLVANPIHIFHLMRRLVNKWAGLFAEVQHILGESQPDVVRQMKTFKASMPNWPLRNDIIGATMSLVRIQYVYQLPLKSLVNGQLREKQTSPKLDAQDCYGIAMDRLQGKNPIRPGLGPEYAVAVEWLEMAEWLGENGNFSVYMTDEEERKELLNMIKEELELTRRKHDHHFVKMESDDYQTDHPDEEFFIEKIAVLDDDGQTEIIRTGQELRRLEDEIMSTRQSASMLYQAQGFHYRDYHQLCRGLKLNRPKAETRHDLKCFYITHGDPYLMIQPVKVEVLSYDPLLWLLHEVITDSDIETMKASATERLARSGVENIHRSEGDAEMSKVTSERIQANAWLWDQEDPTFHRISKRLGHFVNLNVARPDDKMSKQWGTYEAEAFQIGVYSPGGHYLPHIDSLAHTFDMPTDEGFVGNRIATLMFYLSDVVGGGTAFPNIGTIALPVKGSAAFWYSLNSDGTQDNMSVHGACPTIYGIKWVSNKWIREGTQLYKRPCGLEEDERILHQFE